jgi:TetR/AcrR family transcriptional regulator, transcriptional repressor for nem operon
MVQEVYETCPAIREACDASISGHAAKVEADITEAIKRHSIRAKWTARSLALHTQAVLQGAFIWAKAKADAAVAAESIDHLRRYIELLFQPTKRKGKETS